MGVRYEATITVKRWKQHECIDCGCKYRYRLKREVRGTGTTPKTARDSAVPAIAPTVEYEVDVRPCPTCGRVQPDMVGKPRASSHAWVLGGSLVLILGIAALAAYHVIAALGDAAWAAAVVGLGGIFLQLLIAQPDPNARRKENKARAEKLLRSGVIQRLQAGKETRVPKKVPAPMTGQHWFWLLVGAFGAVALAAPALVSTGPVGLGDFQLGMVGGGVLLLVSGLALRGLAKNLAAQAKPVEVYPLEQPAAREAE